MSLPSTIFSLNIKDFLKGLILAVLAPVILTIQQSISAGELTLNWTAIGVTALSAFLAYLLKQFFTDTTAAAQKTIDTAQQKAIDKQNL